MAEDKKEKVKTGYVEVEFLKDFGSYKKGDEATYHNSTVKNLIDKKVIKVTKELEKYTPKAAKK